MMHHIDTYLRLKLINRRWFLVLAHIVSSASQHRIGACVQFALPEKSYIIWLNSHSGYHIRQITYLNSQLLLMPAGTFLEIFDEQLAFQFASIQTVCFQALHHVHFELAAFIVLLMIDKATSHIGQWRFENWRSGHDAVFYWGRQIVVPLELIMNAINNNMHTIQ